MEEERTKKQKDLYVEAFEKDAERICRFLDGQDISYTATPVSVPGMKKEKIHIQVQDTELLTDEQAAELAAGVQAAMQRPRRRKWDEKYHTPAAEAAGYVSGANVEEEER